MADPLRIDLIVDQHAPPDSVLLVAFDKRRPDEPSHAWLTRCVAEGRIVKLVGIQPPAEGGGRG